MTPYITHRRFRGAGICNAEDGGLLNIPALTELECHGDAICFPNGRVVTYRHSQNGIEHFARNDDGNGLLRGKLTHAIAFAERGGDGPRFTDEEVQMLMDEYANWLEPLDSIIFNNDFYDADIGPLRELANRLGITVKED